MDEARHGGINRTRRALLARASALAAAAFLAPSRVGRAEAPPETTRIRLINAPAMCLAPQFLAEDLLHAEGFTQVEYVQLNGEIGPGILANGRADIAMWD